MGIEDLFKTKTGKIVGATLGVVVLSLTAIHYYYAIKINRMKVKELELEQKKLS